MDNEKLAELTVTTGKLFYTVTLLSKVIKIDPLEMENAIDKDWEDIEKAIAINLVSNSPVPVSEEVYGHIFLKAVMAILNRRLNDINNSLQ